MRLLKYAYLKNVLFFTALCFLGGVIHAEKITLSNEWLTKADGSKQMQEGRKSILILVATRMEQNNKEGITFRLVIDKNEVYISDASGETWGSWAASWVANGTANSHNIETHKALLDMIYNTTQEYSRDLLLRAMHGDQRTDLSTLEQKDITLKVLKGFLEVGLKTPLPF